VSNGSANQDASIEAAPSPPKAPSVCRRWALRLCMGLSFLVFIFFGLIWVFWLEPYGSAPFPKEVEIPSGAGLGGVAVMLQRQGLLRSSKAFVTLATLRGQQGRIQAGQYRFEGPVSPRALLQRFTSGEVFLHRITFPEGWTLDQVAERLANEGLVNRDRFVARATDPVFTANLLGFQAPSLEGFLFPDTYHFPSGWEEQRILAALVKRFHQVYHEGLRARTEETGWSILQVVTLASLIEKESALPRERPLISGVFHQRLRRGMRLESDPSVIYGLENFDGNLRRADLEMPHPYNTYRILGLPPGPICNPSIASIRAALYPIDEGYLYFVSRNDGSHHFSHTFREHMVAVARYQLGRNGR
jgi:UPF0755 protein